MSLACSLSWSGQLGSHLWLAKWLGGISL